MGALNRAWLWAYWTIRRRRSIWARRHRDVALCSMVLMGLTAPRPSENSCPGRAARLAESRAAIARFNAELAADPMHQAFLRDTGRRSSEWPED